MNSGSREMCPESLCHALSACTRHAHRFYPTSPKRCQVSTTSSSHRKQSLFNQSHPYRPNNPADSATEQSAAMSITRSADGDGPTRFCGIYTKFLEGSVIFTDSRPFSSFHALPLPSTAEKDPAGLSRIIIMYHSPHSNHVPNNAFLMTSAHANATSSFATHIYNAFSMQISLHSAKQENVTPLLCSAPSHTSFIPIGTLDLIGFGPRRFSNVQTIAMRSIMWCMIQRSKCTLAYRLRTTPTLCALLFG